MESDDELFVAVVFALCCGQRGESSGHKTASSSSGWDMRFCQNNASLVGRSTGMACFGSTVDGLETAGTIPEIVEPDGGQDVTGDVAADLRRFNWLSLSTVREPEGHMLGTRNPRCCPNC